MKGLSLKRVLSFLLVLLMVFTIVPSNTVVALAAEAEGEQVEVIDISVPSEEVALEEAEEILNNEEGGVVEPVALEPEVIDANNDDTPAHTATAEKPVVLKQTGDQSYNYFGEPVTSFDSATPSLYYSSTIASFAFTAEVYRAASSAAVEVSVGATDPEGTLTYTIDGLTGSSIAANTDETNPAYSTITGTINAKKGEQGATVEDMNITVTVGDTPYLFKVKALGFENNDEGKSIQQAFEANVGDVLNYKVRAKSGDKPYFLLMGEDNAVTVDSLPANAKAYWDTIKGDRVWGDSGKYYIFEYGGKTYPIIRAKQAKSIHLHLDNSVSDTASDCDVSAALTISGSNTEPKFGAAAFATQDALEAFAADVKWSDISADNKVYTNNIQAALNSLSANTGKYIFISTLRRTAGGDNNAFEDLVIPAGIKYVFVNNAEAEDDRSPISPRLNTITFMDVTTVLSVSTLDGITLEDAEGPEKIKAYCDVDTSDAKPTINVREGANLNAFDIEAPNNDVTINKPEEGETERKPYQYAIYPKVKQNLFIKNENADWSVPENNILHGEADTIAEIITKATADYGYIRIWVQAWTAGDFTPENLTIPSNIKNVDIFECGEQCKVTKGETEYFVYCLSDIGDPENRIYFVKTKTDQANDTNKYYKVTGDPYKEEGAVDTTTSYTETQVKTQLGEDVPAEQVSFEAEWTDYDLKIAYLNIPAECIVTLEGRRLTGAAFEESGVTRFEKCTRVTTDEDKPGTFRIIGFGADYETLIYGDTNIKIEVDGDVNCYGIYGGGTLSTCVNYLDEDGNIYPTTIRTTEEPLYVKKLEKINGDTTIIYAPKEAVEPPYLKTIQFNWQGADIANDGLVRIYYEDRTVNTYENSCAITYSGMNYGPDIEYVYPEGKYIYESPYGDGGDFYYINQSGYVVAVPLEMLVFNSQAKFDKFNNEEEVEPDVYAVGRDYKELLKKLPTNADSWVVFIAKNPREFSNTYFSTVVIPKTVQALVINPGQIERYHGEGEPSTYDENALNFYMLILENPATKVTLYGGANGILNVNWKKENDNTKITGELRLCGSKFEYAYLMMNGGTLYTGDYLCIGTINGPETTVIEGGLELTYAIGNYSGVNAGEDPPAEINQTMTNAHRNNLGKVVYKGESSLTFGVGSVMNLINDKLKDLLPKLESLNPFNKDTYELITIYSNDPNEAAKTYELYYYKAAAAVNYTDRYTAVSTGDGKFDFEVYEKAFVKIGSSFYQITYTHDEEHDNIETGISLAAANVKATDLERRQAKLKIDAKQYDYDEYNDKDEYVATYDKIGGYYETEGLGDGTHKLVNIEKPSSYIKSDGWTYFDTDGTIKVHNFAIRDKSSVGNFEYKDEEQMAAMDDTALQAYYMAERIYMCYLDDHALYFEKLSDLETVAKNLTNFELVSVYGKKNGGDDKLVIPANTKEISISLGDWGKMYFDTIEFKGSGTSLYLNDVWDGATPKTITVKSADNAKNYVTFEDAIGDYDTIREGLATADPNEYTSIKSEKGKNVVIFNGDNFINNLEGFDQVKLIGNSELYIMKGRAAGKVDLANLVLDNAEGEYASIVFEGYDAAKLPSITSLTSLYGGEVAIGYCTLTKDDEYIAVPSVEAVTAGTKVLNLPETPSAKLIENINKYASFEADKDYYTIDEDGKLTAMKFLDEGKELTKTIKYGGETVTSSDTAVSFKAPKADLAATDKLILSSSKDGSNPIAEVALGTIEGTGDVEVARSFDIPRTTTARNAYVIYKKESGNALVLGKVTIEINYTKPLIKSLKWDAIETNYELSISEGANETAITNMLSREARYVEAVLESNEIKQIRINWEKTSGPTAAGEAPAGTKYVFKASLASNPYGFVADFAESAKTKNVNVDVWADPMEEPQSTNAGSEFLASGSITPAITAPANATVRYTTDGTDPSMGGDSVTEATASGTGVVTILPLTKTTTIRMYVVGNATKLVPDSCIVEFTYYVAETIGALKVEKVEDQTYTGAAIKPQVVVYNNKKDLLVLGKDYTIKGYTNNTNVGEAKVTIKGKGNYSGEIDIPFNIVAAPATDLTVNANVSYYENVGVKYYVLIADKDNKADLSKVVKNITLGKKTLVAKKDDKANDYSVEYYRGATKLDNLVVGFDSATPANNNYTIKYTFTGNYTGTLSVNVVVSGKKDISKATVTGIPKSVIASKNDSDTVIDTSSIVVKDGREVIANTKYTVAVEHVPGTDYNTVTISAKADDADYIGAKTVTYKVVKTKLTDKKAFDWSFIEDKTYTGAPIELADSTIKMTFKDAKGVEHKYTAAEGETPASDTRLALAKDTDYTVQYSKNKNVGTVTVIITATEDAPVTGSVKKTFKINKANLVNLSADKKTTTIDSAVEIYVKDELGNKTVSAKTATERTRIEAQKSLAKPTVIITFNGEKLREDTDYKVTYTNNKTVTDISADKPKYGSIKIEGKGNFAGVIDGTKNGFQGLEFIVTGKSLESSDISVDTSKAYMTYNGKTKAYAYKPVVYDNETKLVLGTDYTLEYEDNNNTGIGVDSTTKMALEYKTATVIIKGKGNYTGQIESEFTIVPQSFDKLAITVNPQIFVKGESNTITKDDVTIKLNAKAKLKLLSNDEFEIIDESYVNNGKVGTAKVTLVSKNPNYPGSKVVTFKITKGTIDQLEITVPNATYSKAGAKPEVTVMDGTTELELNKDYTVKYSNNAAVATSTATKTVKGKTVSIAPTVTITGKGVYSGKAVKTFNITGCNLKTAVEGGDISCIVNPVVWPGATTDVVATATIKQDGKVLAATTTKKAGDYTIEVVEENKKVASVAKDNLTTKLTVKITPNGTSYTGDPITKYVYVLPILPSKMSLTAANKAYGGEAVTIATTDLTLSYTVKVNGKNEKVTIPNAQLANYFTIDSTSYVGNTKVGKAKVTILGKEGTAFEGYKKTITFGITAYNNASGAL